MCREYRDRRPTRSKPSGALRRSAVAASRKQIRKLEGQGRGAAGAAAEEIGYLLDAHLQMLSSSRLVRGVEQRIASDRINAEAAVQAEIAAIAQSFAAIDDPYIAARVDDVREVGDRLIRNLTKTPFAAFSQLPRRQRSSSPRN